MSGIELIAAERERQVAVEGYDAEHDVQHGQTLDLIGAAAGYLENIIDPAIDPATEEELDLPPWPWPIDWEFKPKSKIRDLVRAGALVAAEIDRRLREGEAL